MVLLTALWSFVRMAHDPCKLAKIAVARAVASEGKGCDEHNHPLLGVCDNGTQLNFSPVIKCTVCGTEIDTIVNKLEPTRVTYGDGVKGIEFRVVKRPNKIGTGGSFKHITDKSIRKRSLSSGGTSYSYNSKGMMSRPSFLVPFWKRGR